MTSSFATLLLWLCVIGIAFISLLCVFAVVAVICFFVNKVFMGVWDRLDLWWDAS